MNRDMNLESLSGVVTVNSWLMVPDGASYIHLFCPRWRIVTDKVMAESVTGFRSSEHW